MTREEAIEELEKLKRYVEPRFYRDGYLVALDMAIESLSANYTTKKPNDEVEQKNDVVAEPTDLISRADAIEAVEDGMCTFYDCDVLDRINAVPSADRPSGEWKPVSDGTPQSVGSYIVTCKDEYGSVYVDYDFWTVLDEFKYNCSKVIAWIPFPKPYCGTKMKGEK